MPSTADQLACGFIGLGSQGAPMAMRMIEAGLPTMLWARRAETLEPYRATRALFAESIEAVGSYADHVGLCVVNDDDVRQVCAKLLPAMRARTTLAIHSTIHPDTCREIARQADQSGIRVIDAPVSGGEPAAKEGALTLMLGGDAADIERARPVFETFGRLIIRVGAVGAGQHVKLINNSLFVANLGLAHAALAAGETLQVDRAALVKLLLASSGRSFALDVRARMQSPAGFRHGGALLSKDLRLLREVLGENDSAARTLHEAAQTFLSAAAVNAPAGD